MKKIVIAGLALGAGLTCLGGIGAMAGQPTPSPDTTSVSPSVTVPTSVIGDTVGVIAASAAVKAPIKASARPALTATIKPQPAATRTKARPKPTKARPAAVYYSNCADVHAAGASPLHRGDRGYRAGLDRDGDGVACE